MKKLFFAALMTFIITTLIGCGGDSHPAPQPVVAQIFSDPAVDGDIMQYPQDIFTITQGNTQIVYAGVDPANGAEYRAFLSFPLSGPSGVPSNAVIESASLDIVINSIYPQPLNGTIPIRIDLISYPTPTLFTSDYDRAFQPALLTFTIEPPISQADFGQHVALDVTSFMLEAQRLGLPDFQVRILEDFGAASNGLIEINDTTGPNREALAPLLQVVYH